MKPTALIIAYFSNNAAKPYFLDLFLTSCWKQANIDFIFFSDWKTIPERFYANKYGFFSDNTPKPNLISIFINPHYRTQIIRGGKKKLSTVKSLLHKGNILQIIKATIRQFR